MNYKYSFSLMKQDNMFPRLTGFVCLLRLCSVCGVRVCPTFLDYDWIFSKNCYDNPVVDQNITEIIKSWGFSAEEHYITTEDGYQILLERAYFKNSEGTPIVINHGIGMNALGFVNRGNVSLAYLLGKLGYDVWLINIRGSWYSKGHTSLTPKDPSYWSFSIHEMGIYDVRSVLKHVNMKTKKKAIYIGYSMGTTNFYIYSTMFPEEAKSYVKGMIGLAPVINYKGARSVLRMTASPMTWPVLKSLIYQLWNGEILPGFSIFMWPLIKTSWGMYTIQSNLNLIFGDDFQQMDPLTFPQFATQLVDTAGAEVYGHFVQLYQNEVFQSYDRGSEKNVINYGQAGPLTYNLSKIPVPVALYIGENDWLSTIQNGKQLYSEIPDTSRCGFHIIEYPKWNHLDFLISKDVQLYLYKYLFHKVSQMDSGKCQP